MEHATILDYLMASFAPATPVDELQAEGAGNQAEAGQETATDRERLSESA